MRDIATRERESMARMGDEGRFSYQAYMYLVRETAKTVDRNRRDKARSRGRAGNNHGRRAGNLHEIVGGDDDDEAGPDESLMADLQVFLASRVPGSQMNKVTWDKLSDQAKESWDQISSREKALILGYAQDRAERRAAGGTDPSRKANLHEISGEDTSSGSQTEEEGEVAGREVNSARTSTQAAALKGAVHPGDLRRVLGGSGTKPANGKREASHVRFNNSAAQLRAQDRSEAGQTNQGEELIPCPYPSGYQSDSEEENGGDIYSQLDDYWGEQGKFFR